MTKNADTCTYFIWVFDEEIWGKGASKEAAFSNAMEEAKKIAEGPGDEDVAKKDVATGFGAKITIASEPGNVAEAVRALENGNLPSDVSGVAEEVVSLAITKEAWAQAGDGTGVMCDCKEPWLPTPPDDNPRCSVCKKPFVVEKRPVRIAWRAKQKCKICGETPCDDVTRCSTGLASCY